MTLPVLARIRQIARAGDTLRAWRMFEAAGLPASDAPDALSLKGRLLKDRGLRSADAARAQLLEQAEEAYMRAAGGRRATYPLINAATIAFLNDKTDRAHRLARDVLELLESGDYEPETRYWLGATQAEAELLLGNAEAARRTLESAITATPDAWEDHAVTLRQFRQIVERMGLPADLFDRLGPPPSLYFSGIIGLPEDEGEVRNKLEAELDTIRPGTVFGALAAGADIVVAEMAVARGARLHVVLPTDVAHFREISVTPYGEGWAERFDRLLDEAEVVEALEANRSLSGVAVRSGAHVALGLALRRARTLATRAFVLQVVRAGEEEPLEESRPEQGLVYRRIVLDRSVPARGYDLDVALDRAVLASPGPLLAAPGSIAETSADGVTIRAFDDPITAMEHAAALLRAVPDVRLGLDHRAVLPGTELEEYGELATFLARAAPPGSICAPWPQVAAMDFLAPRFRFEAAGEIVTPLGDVPIGLFCPLSPP